MLEPAATPSTLTQTTDRTYSIDRFYSFVAGASEDRICLGLREDLQKDALHAAYTVEAWLEEIKGREEKYDRLANLARSVAPISDLLRTLSTGVFTGCYAELVKSYEEKSLRSLLAQRYELRQSASEVQASDQVPVEGDMLTVLQNVVSQPEGRDDYVAWFQVGWLQWKNGVLDEAESAFRTAANFSQRYSSWYHAQSLRHEAFIQWKRGNFERARATIRRALESRRDTATLVEAARYAISSGQRLEAQSFVDEALHSDPLVFVSVLADGTFADSVTSTIDILVRQQSRSSESARIERARLEDEVSTIRMAEKQGSIGLLPTDADDVLASAALPVELDFPTAIYRAEQAKTIRSEWLRTALEKTTANVEHKKQCLEASTELLRAAKIDYNSSLDSADTEQRLAEIAVQDEHSAVQLPIVPTLKDESIHGLVISLGVLAGGFALLAGLSQWKFGSIPPLQPIPSIDFFLVSPLLLVMLIFGLFGVVTFPALRLNKANKSFRAAASEADEHAERKLRMIALEGTRKRDAIKFNWTDREHDLNYKINEAQRDLRAAMLAHGTVKQLFH